MRLVVAQTPHLAATLAARFIARRLRRALAAREQATLALSGGTTGVALFAELARLPLDWSRLQVLQVDERVAPAGSPARNLTAIAGALVGPGRLAAARLQAMPVEAPDGTAAALQYAATLARLAGTPPVIDVVHLGLGADGHTASLFPGDPALDASEASVVAVGTHAGFARITLTLPVINAARSIVWLVTGAGKADVLARLMQRGWPAPAGRVARREAVVYADRSAHGA